MKLNFAEAQKLFLHKIGYQLFWNLFGNFLFGFGALLPDGTYIFVPKIPIWVDFREPWNGNC
jgi:hypothetical protein